MAQRHQFGGVYVTTQDNTFRVIVETSDAKVSNKHTVVICSIAGTTFVPVESKTSSYASNFVSTLDFSLNEILDRLKLKYTASDVARARALQRQSLTVLIKFDSSSTSLRIRVPLYRLIPIVEERVSINSISYQNRYYHEPDENYSYGSYGYYLSLEIPETDSNNYLYYYGKGESYFIFNSKNHLLTLNSDLALDSISDSSEAKYFTFDDNDKELQTLFFVGSIGDVNKPVYPNPKDKYPVRGNGGTVLSVVFLDGSIKPDPNKPYIRLCTDPNASNYYLASPYPKGCSPSDGNFADLAAAQAVEDTYQIVDAPYHCCTYDSIEDETFDGSAQILTVPTEAEPAGGSIQFDWEGGTGPYDLTFTCAQGDTGCSGASVTNTSDLTYTVTGLEGTEDPAFTYGLTVTDATGLSIFLQIGGLASVEAATNLNCKSATAINYLNTGTTENHLCVWCSPSTGTKTLVEGGIGATNIPLAHFDSQLDNFGDEYTKQNSIFSIQASSFLNPTGGTTVPVSDGSVTVKVYIKDLINNNFASDYTFELGNSTVSPDIDGSGGFIKLERKRLYNSPPGQINFQNLNISEEDGDALWNAGSSEQTPTETTYVDAGTTTLSGGLLSSLSYGRYIYRISYTDTNTAHDIENCYSYFTIIFRVSGCTDPFSGVYVNDAFAQSNLILSDSTLCTYPTQDDEAGTIQDSIDGLFNFQFVTINDDNMDPCEFEASISFQPADVGNNNPVITGGFDFQYWTFAGSTGIFFGHILNHISIEHYGATSNLNNLNIVNATYSTVFYTLDANNDQQVNEFQVTNQGNAVNGTPIQFYLFDDSGIATGNYDFNETFIFGSTPSALNIPIGVQSAKWTFDVEFNDVIVEEGIEINLMPDGPKVFSIAEVITDGGATTFLNSLGGGVLCADCTGLEELLTPGCTDPAACNYNITATTDDGSCVGYQNPGTDQAQISPNGQWYSENLQQWGSPCGCIDSNYQEFSAIAFDYSQIYGTGEIFPTGSAASACVTPNVYGCTDPSFVEYNPGATEDDGSCETYVVNGCTDPTACNFDESTGANTDDGSCYYEVPSTDCVDFDNWQITAYQAPITCTGDSTNTGVVTITNYTWTGPVSFRVLGNGGEYGYDFESVEGDFVNTQLAGVQDVTGLGLVVHPGNYISEQGGNNGVTILSQQDSVGGTSFTISNITAGSYTFLIYPYLEESPNQDPNPCYCSTSNITIADGIADSAFITPLALSLDGGDGYDIGSFTFNAEFGRSNGRGTCGCCDPSSGTYDPTIDPANGGVCNQALCADYGCTDPEANNYNPNAALPCSDPENQNGAGGIPCTPCKYGYVDSLYNPAFCMPKKTSQQIDIIRRCIGTAGTNAFMNVITGKSDCATKDAWKLILIEYLMSKKGLDCIYNCADSSTPSLEALQSCKDKANGKRHIIEHLAHNILSSQVYYVGDTHRFSYTGGELVAGVERYYTLTYLPEDEDPNIFTDRMRIYSVGYTGYDGMAVEDLPYYKYAPNNFDGWKLCEEPPNKPNNKNYIGKFINFVQNYCRQCQIPVNQESAATSSTTESVITVNGIVITVNNSNIR